MRAKGGLEGSQPDVLSVITSGPTRASVSSFRGYGKMSEKDTFIVAAVDTGLTAIKKSRSFIGSKKRCFRRASFFVDVWVLSCLTLSIVSYLLSFLFAAKWLHVTILVLSIVRISEYVPYLLFILIFSRRQKGTTDLRSYRRLLLLLMCNYVETIFWFATWYSILTAHGYLRAGGPLPVSILRESIMLMVANWSGNFTELSKLAWAVVTVHDFLGLLMTVVVGARFISLLPRPTSADPEEK